MALAMILAPFRRGFFCDDDSIMLPNLESIVSTSALYWIALTVPILLILWGEFAAIRRNKNSKWWYHHYEKHEIVHYFRNVLRKLICFGSGELYQELITSIGKITVGRLRPNFIAVCGTDVLKACRNNTHQYVYNYTCPNGEDAANESRSSFPSGHAALSFYAAVFTVLYLQKRLKFETLFWKPLIQCCILLLAWWVSLTRVMDNHHHMSDVIAGIFIGSGIAIINVIWVHSLFEEEEPLHNLNSNPDSSKKSSSETESLLQKG
ncbi:putative phosphatidate phosphatase [Planococcus citri]|uniref:putative phosphatidate phosphatase n=1 Tax=Planococcus citri TaxID=170843 RepID=UPI0031F7A6EA